MNQSSTICQRNNCVRILTNTVVLNQSNIYKRNVTTEFSKKKLNNPVNSTVKFNGGNAKHRRTNSGMVIKNKFDQNQELKKTNKLSTKDVKKLTCPKFRTEVSTPNTELHLEIDSKKPKPSNRLILRNDEAVAKHIMKIRSFAKANADPSKVAILNYKKYTKGNTTD